MDPLHDRIAPTRQGYVKVPLYPLGHAGAKDVANDAAAAADADANAAAAAGPSLFYEVFSPSEQAARALPSLGAGRDPCDKVVLIMGAFCTRRMFEPLAAELARRGFHALVYDHRNVGASAAASAASAAAAASVSAAPSSGGGGEGGADPPSVGPELSARLLAADALAVADRAFSNPPSLHVLGASMGGMVASELAALLARGEGGGGGGQSGGGGGGGGESGPAASFAPSPSPPSRLASLTVMVSCRGLQPALWRALGISVPRRPLEPLLRWLFPVPPRPAPALEKKNAAAAADNAADIVAAPASSPPPACPAVARMVERLLRDIVCARLLDTPFPDQRRAAESLRLLGGAAAAAAAAASDGGSGGGGGARVERASALAVTPPPQHSPLTYRDVYRAVWRAEFHELFCFADPSVGAAHTSVVLSTRFPGRKAALVRSSGAPVLCLVAERDGVIAPRAQLELARMLGARVLSVPTGHVGLGPWAGVFYAALDETLRQGRVAMSAAHGSRGSSSGGGGGGGRGGSRGSGGEAAMAAATAPAVVAVRA